MIPQELSTTDPLGLGLFFHEVGHKEEPITG